MECRDVRERLAAGGAARPPEAAAHLERCPECRRIADRHRLARAALREHLHVLEPGPGFASRIGAELERPAEVVGWAALRLLPATLALVLVLLAWTVATSSAPAGADAEVPADELLSWIAPLGEGSR